SMNACSVQRNTPLSQGLWCRRVAVNDRSSTGVTAERIHDAALTLFNDRGYTGTTVRELADASAQAALSHLDRELVAGHRDGVRPEPVRERRER
ncbi:MAG: TetR family transcriptional regulator, partial [Pyrinomonadaceae bacterium]